GPSESIQLPTDQRAYLPGPHIRFQLTPARTIHRLAAGLIPIPLHRAVIGARPALQVRLLAPKLLPIAGHTEIDRSDSIPRPIILHHHFSILSFRAGDYRLEFNPNETEISPRQSPIIPKKSSEKARRP